MDHLICEILHDCKDVNPPLDRNEIAQHVVGHMSNLIHKDVCLALERLVRLQIVAYDACGEGKSFRFRLLKQPSERH
jgi:hypothetical protein